MPPPRLIFRSTDAHASISGRAQLWLCARRRDASSIPAQLPRVYDSLRLAKLAAHRPIVQRRRTVAAAARFALAHSSSACRIRCGRCSLASTPDCRPMDDAEPVFRALWHLAQEGLASSTVADVRLADGVSALSSSMTVFPIRGIDAAPARADLPAAESFGKTRGCFVSRPYRWSSMSALSRAGCRVATLRSCDRIQKS